MSPRPPTTRRTLSWDAVRVVAVVSVVVQHATYTVSGVMPFLEAPPFVWAIEAGANTLMVVSGFFVCATLAKRRAGGWWWNRMARLLPAFAVAVLITYLVTLVAARYGYWRPTLVDLIGNLLLLESWSPHVIWVDASYWTLPLQIGVFTLAAVLVAVCGRRFWGRRWVLPALAWVGIAGPVVLDAVASGWVRAVYDGLVVFRWQLFAIGLAVWLASRGRIAVPHVVALVTAGIVAEYLITPDVASVAALAVACVGIGAAALGPDWSALRLGPLPRVISWLAGISYGIYLMNQQLGYFAAWWLQQALGVTGWARLAVVVVLAVVLGWLLTVLVERPVHRLLTSRSRQRGNDSAAPRNRSFSSGVPAETRTPEPANARTTTL